MPLDREGLTVGYVVVVFEGASAPHVRLALAAAAPRLARLLPEPALELRLAAAGDAR